MATSNSLMTQSKFLELIDRLDTELHYRSTRTETEELDRHREALKDAKTDTQVDHIHFRIAAYQVLSNTLKAEDFDTPTTITMK